MLKVGLYGQIWMRKKERRKYQNRPIELMQSFHSKDCIFASARLIKLSNIYPIQKQISIPSVINWV